MTDDRNREDAMHENEDLLNQIFSGSPIPMFMIDRNHVVTHFNRSCEILTGITAAEIIGTNNQWMAFYKQRRPVMADIILNGNLSADLETHYNGKYKISSVRPGAIEAFDFFPDLGEDGRWLFFTAAPVKNSRGEVVGALETLQDMTSEHRETELNSVMLRISKTLHKYAYLTDILGYISMEVKDLLSAEGALVVMHDEEAGELFLPGIACDDPERERRLKDLRFSLDELVAGEVIRLRKPVIRNTLDNDGAYFERDRKMGYVTRNLVEAPIFSDDRIIGVLCAINKKGGIFTERDAVTLSTLSGTVALAIENVRYSEELRKAYREVRALNAAKDKAINHLSHELKTPLTVLAEAVSLLEEELAVVPEESWKPLSAMIRRHMKRLMDIKDEVADIIGGKDGKTQAMMLFLMDQCSDLLSVLAAREAGNADVAGKLKKHIEGIFKPVSLCSEDIFVADFLFARLAEIKPCFKHRDIRITEHHSETRPIHIPKEILSKIIDGLMRNAVENTPDGGLIECSIYESGSEVYVKIKDYGTGIPEDLHPRIFEGFFPTQSITTYSTRKPYDFNAGGKGADLLRMKIFSETYGFSLSMRSKPCPFCHEGRGPCPGKTEKCSALNQDLACEETGGTEFVLTFL